VVKEGVMWMMIAVGWKTYFIVRVKGMKMSGVDILVATIWYYLRGLGTLF
jgi:hypothetical protein